MRAPGPRCQFGSGQGGSGRQNGSVHRGRRGGQDGAAWVNFTYGDLLGIGTVVALSEGQGRGSSGETRAPWSEPPLGTSIPFKRSPWTFGRRASMLPMIRRNSWLNPTNDDLFGRLRSDLDTVF